MLHLRVPAARLIGARRYATEDIINLRSCRQNPELLEIIATVGAPDPMQQANLAPNCTAVDYCASAHSATRTHVTLASGFPLEDSYPKWCYINVRNLDDSEFKTLCSQLAWSWCSDQTSAPARWRFLSGSTILGNEKRFETIYLHLGLVQETWKGLPKRERHICFDIYNRIYIYDIWSTS